MPRIFGSKLVDGVKEEKKKCKIDSKKKKKKTIYQSKVEFE
jgi:hypothetical protein